MSLVRCLLLPLDLQHVLCPEGPWVQVVSCKLEVDVGAFEGDSEGLQLADSINGHMPAEVMSGIVALQPSCVTAPGRAS